MRAHGPFVLACFLAACSVTTTTTSPPDDGSGAGAGGGSGDNSSNPPPASSTTPPPAASSGPWGKLTDHGERNVDVSNLTSPPACDDVCKTVGGTCNASYAGDDDYKADHAMDGEYASFGGRFYDCSYPEQATLVQGSQTFHLDQLSCHCEGAVLETPYVDVVTAKDGAHACADVCTGWKLTCADGIAFATAQDQSGAKLACADVPKSAHHYRCDCKK